MADAQMQPRDVNILLLGESGAGKSTFINSLANYLEYQSLKEAMVSEIKWKVPARFTVTDENYDEITISIGNPDTENYSGHIVTKRVTDYEFLIRGNVIMHLIDTPPLGGDEENMDLILSHISKCSHLNAVVFFLKPNVSILTQYFKYCLNSLLSRLNGPVFKNIVFVFTHTRSTFYKPGETLSILQNVVKDMGVEANVNIPCSKENMFCLDNETFRYLVANKDGVQSEIENMKVFSQSWELSSQCCQSLMKYIVGVGEGTGLQPFRIQIPITNKTMLETIVKFFDILADISLVLHENIQILQSKEIIASKKNVPLVTLVKVKPAIRCTHCKKKVLSHEELGCTVYKCIQNEADFAKNIKSPSRSCKVCDCSLGHHKEIFYLQEFKSEPISEDNERKVELIKLISLLENEMELILQVLAMFQIFRKSISTVPSDYYKDFLENQTKKKYLKPKYADIKKKYHKILTNLRKQTVTSYDIEIKLRNLYDLRYTGEMLRTICKDLLPKNEVFKKQSTKISHTIESPTMEGRKLYGNLRNKICDNSEKESYDNSERQTYDTSEAQNVNTEELVEMNYNKGIKDNVQQNNPKGNEEKIQDHIHITKTDNCHSRKLAKLKGIVDELNKEISQYKYQNYRGQKRRCSLGEDQYIHNKQELQSNNTTIIKNTSNIRTNKVSEKVEYQDCICKTSSKGNSQDLHDEPYKPKAISMVKVGDTAKDTSIPEGKGENATINMKIKMDVMRKAFLECDQLVNDKRKNDDESELINAATSYIIRIVHLQFETIEELIKKIDSLEKSLNNKFDKASHIPAEVKAKLKNLETLEARILALENNCHNFTSYENIYKSI